MCTVTSAMRFGLSLLIGLSAVWTAFACGGSDDDGSGRSMATNRTDPSNPAASSGGANGGTSSGASGNELQHILATGQSNSIGFAARPPLTSDPVNAFGNLMFDTGVMTATGCDDEGCTGYEKPTKLVPLAEGDHYFNYTVETMSSGVANAIAKKTGATLIASVHGRSGNTYECLRKSGCAFLRTKGYTSAFDEAMNQVEDAKALATAAGKKYRVGAVTVVHGESDHYANQFPIPASTGSGPQVATYADALIEWQRDYDASIRAVTSQSAAVPLLVSQMSNWNDRPSSDIPEAQLDAHNRAAGKVVLVGPTYMLPYAADCIHFTNHGLRQLGEYFAKAYARVVVEGGKWEPVRPLSATKTNGGSSIQIKFAVPKPPLVFDSTAVKDPGNFGFEVVDDASGAPVSIANVQISGGGDTVTINLATAPSGAVRARYAMTATPNTCPGPQTGPRGNLRDSDDAQSIYGYPLQNWAVHFETRVP